MRQHGAAPVTSTTFATPAFITFPSLILRQLGDSISFHPNMDTSSGNGNGPEKQETTPQVPTLQSLEEPRRLAKPAKPSTGLTDTLVWWDIENCPHHSAPSPSTGEVVKTNCLIRELQSHQNCDQIRVTINIYGNDGPDLKSGLGSLVASGITLQHRILPCKLPRSETAALKTMMVDIALWALSNPASSNIFLIFAARDTFFRDLVTGLHIREYNIHLATKFFWSTTANTIFELNGFNPIPCHWSASREHLFVVRTAPSRRSHSFRGFSSEQAQESSCQLNNRKKDGLDMRLHSFFFSFFYIFCFVMV